MADTREEKIKNLKQELALITISLVNAKNKLTEGRVVNAATIQELSRTKIGLEDQIRKLENPEVEPPASQPPAPAANSVGAPAEEEYGIPGELRIPRRPYTMSPAAREQRRNAARSDAHAESMKGNQNAWKTGEHAQGLIRQIFRPCKSTCPQYPCKLIEEGNTEPGEACLDKEEFMRSLSAMQEAIRDGKADAIKDLASVRIAGVWEVVRMLTEDVLTDNTIVKSQKFDKDGNVVGFEVKPNPALLPLAKLVEVSGLTAPEWMVTPRQIKKADGDEKAAETLATLMGKVSRTAFQQKDEERPA